MGYGHEDGRGTSQLLEILMAMDRFWLFFFHTVPVITAWKLTADPREYFQSIFN
jgi:hypothetical protein